MNKAKLEVGDDPSKSGVYSMTLAINNVKGTSSLTYDVGAIVMTEGVSDTLTDHQETTVTEQGYLLEGASIKVEGNGVSGTSVTVGAGQSVTVTEGGAAAFRVAAAGSEAQDHGARQQDAEKLFHVRFPPVFIVARKQETG